MSIPDTREDVRKRPCNEGLGPGGSKEGEKRSFRQISSVAFSDTRFACGYWRKVNGGGFTPGCSIARVSSLFGDIFIIEVFRWVVSAFIFD